MGRTNYYQEGYGYTEQEARSDALSEARDEYGHQEGYSGSMASATTEKVKCLVKPKRSKTCLVDKTVQKGARKWETVFVIEQTWGFSGGNYPKGKVVRGTQGEALKEAKRMALANQQEYTVRIDKRLSTGSNEIARIKPKKSTAGKWAFSGEARC